MSVVLFCAVEIQDVCIVQVLFSLLFGFDNGPHPAVLTTSLSTQDRGLWMVFLLLMSHMQCYCKNPYILIFLLTSRLLGCVSFKYLIFELGSWRHQYLSSIDIPMLKIIQVS